MKTLEAIEFDRSGVSAGQLRTLAEDDYVAGPVPLIGEAGTGNSSGHPLYLRARAKMIASAHAYR
jgi:hypothetical protein